MPDNTTVVLVATSRDVARIPEEWREYPVIVDALVPPGMIYLTDDPELLEKLDEDRERLGLAVVPNE